MPSAREVAELRIVRDAYLKVGKGIPGIKANQGELVALVQAAVELAFTHPEYVDLVDAVAPFIGVQYEEV